MTAKSSHPSQPAAASTVTIRAHFGSALGYSYLAPLGSDDQPSGQSLDEALHAAWEALRLRPGDVVRITLEKVP